MGSKTEADVHCVLMNSVRVTMPEELQTSWETNQWVIVGNIRTHCGKRYKALQSHITRIGWEPDKTPDLWVTTEDGYASWVQPAGAHDAYAQGDKAIQNGKTWQSIVDSNVWAPCVRGWEERSSSYESND